MYSIPYLFSCENVEFQRELPKDDIERTWNGKKKIGQTSLAPLIIPCSLSICTHCCSSANANAHGTPSKKALVLRIHRALPPNDTVFFVNEVSVEKEVAMRCRDCGGMMSRSAAIRSNRVSSSRVE
jgi:hypothetical protein